jgi:sarcosine oxidase subunit gamma
MSSLNTETYIEPAPLQLGALQQCVLVDLTEVPRVGFRGQQSADYLQARGFNLPDDKPGGHSGRWQPCGTPVAD